ncbi:hypothetical protein K2173_016267 [Erythroxylum novogranatense]|uniref:Protein kinase domain-containing protein n=1 Tax=Erythroxylum novogranatense TaxID=1862640 RepID=A0AAV8SFR3_9ROSI|nr:hypothetical protein K2173_016267 [Erythroxylum novogranatense]
MGLVVEAIFQLVKLCVIGFICTAGESAAYNVSPSPAISSEVPSTMQSIATPVHLSASMISSAPISEIHPNISNQPSVAQVLVPTPPRNSEENKPADLPLAPSGMPSAPPAVPVGSPEKEKPHNAPAMLPIMPVESPSMLLGPDASHVLTPHPGINWKKEGIPVAASPDEIPKPLDPVANSPDKGSTVVAPSMHKAVKHSGGAPVPSRSYFPSKGYQTPASPPSIPFHKQNHTRNKTDHHASALSPPIYPPSTHEQDPVIPPSFLRTKRHTRYASSDPVPGPSASASHGLFREPATIVLPAPSPSLATSVWTEMPILSPSVSSSRSSKPFLLPVQPLPPPPPNEDCSTTVCVDPYTNTPPGSPCGCVLPIQVGLRLSVALYTFFPLVSKLSHEIATGVFMKRSQVHIMAANATSQQPEKTIVHIDLVPAGERFDDTTAFLIFRRFWKKLVVIKTSLFGDYEVLYVNYPGLPPSPPSGSINIEDDGPNFGYDTDDRKIKPLGADVTIRQNKNGLGGRIIAVIVLSGFVALVLCSAVAWILLFRHKERGNHPATIVQTSSLAVAKPSGTTGSRNGSGPISASLSFGSSIAPYTGSAKTFSIGEIERATNDFDASRILGEGGFGRVYSGILEDGTKVAVKVLKRDDQQGSREFLAEVEMLSRLHHRNLVKLIGICTEVHAHCLVYELIPNGSVESHLHGFDKESAPLGWNARIKIALGAARGLAYLHEDSNPPVIHRDFKSSNILLEHDFTPKVSDFGLARTAMDEENRHISTRVMGTFGYVAPEYAMTGHLLVKSDVYSYGVVLLEILTGRKPVDMTQPPGQENLVVWARPLLTNKEGLETIMDPSLRPHIPLDSVAKVAAIASMCVQPEASHRPFMGEVVQALKLICNECDEAKEAGSRSSSQDLSIDMDAEDSGDSRQLLDPFQNRAIAAANYDSEPDIERALSMSNLFGSSARYNRQGSSFRRYSSSGPLATGRSRWFWQRLKRLRGESVSEHGIAFRIWSPVSH